MRKILLAALSCCALVTASLFAQSDIDIMFSEDDFTDDAIVETPTTSKEEPPLTVGFSGEIKSSTTYAMHKDFVRGRTDGFDKNSLSQTFAADLALDVRLRKGAKAYLSGNILYNPLGTTAVNAYTVPLEEMTTNIALISSDTTTITLDEAFVSAMLMFEHSALSFIIGKQALSWGRGYFWNPSDLINTEKKDFTDVTAKRTGVYGLKATYAFGTLFNAYAFVDTGSATNFDEPAIAGKFEWTMFGMEASISGWAKEGARPLYAADFSARIPWINVDVRGEASLQYGEIMHAVHRESTYETYTYDIVATNTMFGEIPILMTTTNIRTNYVEEETKFDQWIPKISLGFTKTFDVFDVDDRLSIVGEFFYNGAGYYGNIFESLNNAGISGMEAAVLLQRYYNPLYHSAYYGAVFVSISDFFNPNLSFAFNALGNFVDYSFTLMAGLTYSPIYNFTLGFNALAYLSDGTAELTFSGNMLSGQVTVTVDF